MTQNKPTPKTKAPAAVLLAALAVVLAGCTAGTTPTADDLVGKGADHPVLYLNVTANGQTHRYTSDDLPGSGGDAPGGSASATATGSNATVGGNATSGNSTAQGNASASPNTATGQASAGNATGGSGSASQGMPAGDAPLNVSVEMGASGLEEGLPLNWTLDWGDAAATSGGNTSASASGNGSAAKDELTGSSLPARGSYSFTKPGQHAIAFSLLGKAGEALQSVKAVVAVAQANAGPAPGTSLGNQTEVFEGAANAVLPPLCSALDTFEWKLNQTMNGALSVVDRIVITVDSSGTGDVTLTLRDANETEIASGGSIDAVGPFPPGAYTIEVEACPAANLEYSVTAIGHHIAK